MKRKRVRTIYNVLPGFAPFGVKTFLAFEDELTPFQKTLADLCRLGRTKVVKIEKGSKAERFLSQQ